MSFFIQTSKWMTSITVSPATFILEAPTFQMHVFVYNQQSKDGNSSVWHRVRGNYLFKKMWIQQGKWWYTLKYRCVGENSIFLLDPWWEITQENQWNAVPMSFFLLLWTTVVVYRGGERGRSSKADLAALHDHWVTCFKYHWWFYWDIQNKDL